MSVKLVTKVVRIMRKDESPDAEEATILASVDWNDVEDSLNDQLPEGYYAKIDDNDD